MSTKKYYCSPHQYFIGEESGLATKLFVKKLYYTSEEFKSLVEYYRPIIAKFLPDESENYIEGGTNEKR